MKKIVILLITGLGVLWLSSYNSLQASNRAERYGKRFAATQPWHAPYYHTAWGYPVALVVPPNADTQVRMGWGVAQTERVHIYHQFRRPYPGPDGGASGVMLNPTPHFPSHTDQFGVYYIRAPW